MAEWPAKLRAARMRAKLSQSAVAERLGVSQATVADYESAAANLTEATVQRYCDAIGVDVSLVIRTRR